MSCFFKFIVVVALVCLQACTSTSLSSSAGVDQPRATTPLVKVVVAEGQAVIEQGGKLLAKRQALQDAIRQASMQAGVAVNSQTLLNQGSIKVDTVALHSAAQVSDTQILNEWVAGDIYYVRAKVSLTNSDTCIPHYRKRILATAFPLAEPSQVSSSESQDLYSGIPREINNLLMESREYIGINATQISLYSQPQLAPEVLSDEPYKASKVMQIAAANGAQLVLSGVIRDLQIESGDYIRGSGPAGMLKSWLRDVWSRRGIGIDVYVHDGFTGALVFQYRYVDSVVGDVWIPANYTVGSERFKATPTGEKISKIIEQASLDIRKSLSCYPFSTRIVKIEKDKVFIDAGAQDNLNLGDQLVIYADGSEEFNLEGGRQYVDHDKRPVGMLILNDIRPRYAIGSFEFDSQSQGVKVGDWVRSW